MNTLVTLLKVGGLMALVVMLGGCACGHHGHYDCYDCYDRPEVVIIEVPDVPPCYPYPGTDPVIVQSPPPRRQPIERVPIKSTPPPRSKQPQERPARDKPIKRPRTSTRDTPRTR